MSDLSYMRDVYILKYMILMIKNQLQIQAHILWYSVVVVAKCKYPYRYKKGVKPPLQQKGG